MTDQLKNDNFPAPQQTESDVLALIKGVRQQLTFLEKKIDILINQSQEKPFREKHFSKPFRSFSHSDRPGRYSDKRGQGGDSRERSFHSVPHFEKREQGEHRGFSGPKRDYSDGRENSSQDRPFKKKYGDSKRGFDSRKKPFFHQQKGR